MGWANQLASGGGTTAPAAAPLAYAGNPVTQVAPTTAALQADLAAINPNADFTGQSSVLKQQITDNNYKDQNANTYNTLLDAGYTGKYTEQKNWGAYDTLGGTANARKLYDEAFAYGQSTGDWSQMESFMSGAEAGNRKYHRNGAFGLGIDLMPHSLLDAGLLFGGAAAGLGAFKGLGLPGLVPGSEVASNAAGSAFSGIEGFNSASQFAQPLSAGSTLSSLPSGVGSAVSGIGGASSGLSLSNLKHLTKLGGIGGNEQGQPAQLQYAPYLNTQQTYSALPNITPNFEKGSYNNAARNNLQNSINVPYMGRQPFMSVQDMYNARKS